MTLVFLHLIEVFFFETPDARVRRTDYELLVVDKLDVDHSLTVHLFNITIPRTDLSQKLEFPFRLVNPDQSPIKPDHQGLSGIIKLASCDIVISLYPVDDPPFLQIPNPENFIERARCKDFVLDRMECQTTRNLLMVNGFYDGTTILLTV